MAKNSNSTNPTAENLESAKRELVAVCEDASRRIEAIWNCIMTFAPHDLHVGGKLLLALDPFVQKSLDNFKDTGLADAGLEDWRDLAEVEGCLLRSFIDVAVYSEHERSEFWDSAVDEILRLQKAAEKASAVIRESRVRLAA